MSDSTQIAEAEAPVDTSNKNDTKLPKETLLPPQGLGLDLDSESSEDERTAFDRVRVPSDSDESDVEKPADDIPATADTSGSPVSTEVGELVDTAVPEQSEQQTEPTSEKLEESVDATTEKTDPALSESTDKGNADVSPDRAALVEHSGIATSPSKEEAVEESSPATSKGETRSLTGENRQLGEDEKSGKSKHSERDKGNRWVKEYVHESNYENPRGETTRRERDMGGRSYRRERERGRPKRENYSSYGHDDRFYADSVPRESDDYGEFRVPVGNSPRPRQGRGGKGRGGEDRWKHDKFNEEEQGPITVESNYSPPQRYESPSTSYDKKGRGRGKKQLFNDNQAPVPGFARGLPRQEHRGRGIRPRARREDPDSRRSKGRGGSRHGYGDTEEDLGFDLSKPIVFVSQKKQYDSSYERERSHRGPALNSNELVKIGESEYIQSNASTPLPTISILTSTQARDPLLNDSKENVPQMKSAGSSSQKRDKYSDTPGIISFAGVGRGKGSLLAKFAREQSGKDPSKRGEPIFERETRAYKESSPLPATDPALPYQMKNKPQRQSAQIVKQQTNANPRSEADVPDFKFGVPNSTQEVCVTEEGPATPRHGTPNTKHTDKETQAASGKLEHSRPDKRSTLADLKYSEFYPSPYKEEMVGNQMAQMQQFNFMPDGSIMQDYMLPPEVKDGDPHNPQSFHQIQFPPFMPQDMAMNMKGPEMLGGVPYMGNPTMAPEYLMPNEVPPNLQSDLFVPMSGFYPPI